MFIHRIYFALIFAGLLMSCGNRQQQQTTAENVITIDDSELTTHYKSSDIFEDITFIPLETSDTCIIGHVAKIKIMDDVIYVLDMQSRSLFAFTKDGKFKSRIGNVGQGPNEYISFEDFTVMKNGDILILDGGHTYGKLIRFQPDGTPVKSYRLPFACDAVECLTDTLLVFNGSGFDDNVIVWNIHEEKTVNSFFKFDIKHAIRMFQPLIKYKDMVYFIRPRSLSMIYNVTPEKLENKWFIDFGKRNTDSDKLVTNKIMGMEILGIPPYAAGIDSFTETDDYVIFLFVCNELNGAAPYYVYYSKKTGKKKILNYKFFDDDITFYGYPDVSAVTNSGQIIYTFFAYQLLEIIANYHGTGNIQALKDKLKGLNEFDNPVVALYTVKSF
jgi:hypothetical protein